MVKASIGIVVILLIACYAILRSRRRFWAGGVLPLLLTPLLNIPFMTAYFHFPAAARESDLIRWVFYGVLLAATALWAVLWSHFRLPQLRLRFSYVVGVVGFTAIVSLIFLWKGLVVR